MGQHPMTFSFVLLRSAVQKNHRDAETQSKTGEDTSPRHFLLVLRLNQAVGILKSPKRGLSLVKRPVGNEILVDILELFDQEELGSVRRLRPEHEPVRRQSESSLVDTVSNSCRFPD